MSVSVSRTARAPEATLRPARAVRWRQGKDMKKTDILTLCIVLFLLMAIACAVCRCEKSEERYYHNSTGGWPEDDLCNLVKRICEKKGLEYDEAYQLASWTALVCPKCGQGNAYLTAVDETTYCPYCRWPIGLDWGIRRLGAYCITIEDTGYNFTIEVCTFPEEETE